MSHDKLPGEDAPRLDELTKEEFRSVAKLLDANYSDEKYEKDWADFIEKKRLIQEVQGSA
jgi:hypothetical protein